MFSLLWMMMNCWICSSSYFLCFLANWIPLSWSLFWMNAEAPFSSSYWIMVLAVSRSIFLEFLMISWMMVFPSLWRILPDCFSWMFRFMPVYKIFLNTFIEFLSRAYISRLLLSSSQVLIYMMRMLTDFIRSTKSISKI